MYLSWYSGGCGSGSVLGTSSSITVSPTSNTTYYVRRVGNSPCNNTPTSCAFVTVSVSTPPTAPTSITGTTTICSGNSTTLTASGGSTGSGCSYQWYSGGCSSGSVLGTGSSITVSPTSNTTYYVRRVGNSPCSNTTGCTSVTVSVSTPPIAPTGITSSNGTTIYSGNSTTLTATGGSEGSGCSYQWGTGSCGSNIISGQTSSSIPASPNTTTTYWVRRVGTSPCNSITTTCATQNITVTTAPIAPTITTPFLPNGIINTSYSETLTATGTTPITWIQTNGSLPDGLSLGQNTGVISGKPNTAGTFNFTVQATNIAGNNTKALSITIGTSAIAPTITTTSLPNGTIGSIYNQSLTATGTAPITWSYYSGNLPSGLSLDQNTGVISGTPTTAGTFNFTVQATNTIGSDTKNLSIIVNPSGSFISVTDVIISPCPATLKVNGTLQLTTTILPSNATNKNVNWSSSNNSIANVSSSGRVTALNCGTALISAVATDGSNEIGTCMVTVDCLGIIDVENSDTKIYPNPTKNQLIIDCRDAMHCVSTNVEIYNVVGQLLQSKIVNLQSKTTIDISHLANGMYFLKVDNKVVKIIKN